MAKYDTAKRKFTIQLINRKGGTVDVAGEFVHQKAIAAARQFAEDHNNERVRVSRIRPGQVPFCTNEWYKGVQVR